MARQQTRFDPAVKEFEAYLDFSGGHNSEVSNERLADHEFPVMVNVDNSGRGSAKTRSGRRRVSSVGANRIQGLFNFYRSDTSEPDIIIAYNGRLYVYKPAAPASVPDEIVIAGSFTYQTTMTVEAAQYRNNMFVATGSGLVEVTVNSSGTYTAKVVEPYKPTAQEVLYIGTNALADNPDDYIQDGVGTLAVVGVKPAQRQGAVGQEMTFTTFINRPAGDTGTVDYKWERKRSSDSTWTVHKDFTAGLKTTTISFDTATNYDIRVTIRKTSSTTPTAEYTLTNFTVKATADPPSMPVDAIKRCRKIILHWDRILLTGDDKYPYQVYISDLENPRYFPTTNTISFDFGKQEPITSIVRFQDMLVFFTRTTIQTLIGKSTGDYARYLIHDGLGCVAPRSAVVVGNNVLFMSHDGIYALKPNPYRIETMNVARVDHAIQEEIDPTQIDACAMVYDNQYWLCFPQKKTMYRYYYERKVWVKDQSDGLDLVQFLSSGDDIYNASARGKLLLHDDEYYLDDGAVYNMEISSKFYDLSASFNNKKLKRLYILAKHETDYTVDLFVSVKADSAEVLVPETSEIVKDEPGGWYFRVVPEPNFEFRRGTTFGSWVLGESQFGDLELSVQRASIRGKCRRVKLSFYAPSTTPCEVYGFAFEFKLKKI